MIGIYPIVSAYSEVLVISVEAHSTYCRIFKNVNIFDRKILERR